MGCKCNFCELRKPYCLKFCGGCRLVFYCSEVCQSNDWASHKVICEVNTWRMPRQYGELAKDFVGKGNFLSSVLDSRSRMVSGFSPEVVRVLDEAVELHSLTYPAMHKDRYRVISNAEAFQLHAVVLSSRPVMDKLFVVSKRLSLVASLFLPGMGSVCGWGQSELVLARLSFGLTCEDVEDLKRRFLKF